MTGIQRQIAVACHWVLSFNLLRNNSKLVIHLDTSIYDENSAEKLEAEWKDGKMEYKEIIIAPSASKSKRKYWKIIENTKMKQKGINHNFIRVKAF